MSLAIFWTDEATETFDSIVLFIENRWALKQAEGFVKHTQKILSLIADQPYMYKASLNGNNVRQAIISPQTSMFYEIHHEFITILFFWDNRQEPIF
ncbi:type II toxin-antitoxin system RelE/ParE family toxin [Mucilaginibacter sp.]|uniref:type II toxin-antitoxin system RelE/ParE family toxin n=1 Tax=Mucilaginibacter sp. TaxID=1882438 RepID=UPI0026142C65|nr:type II toxin-antitoxin system RelE/ParE family toxin [Mucilaginibacter sp.]MDB5031045.1 type toxin-antitoxin system RelE/ParE family toxin [Mucilaginibacter sp.]